MESLYLKMEKITADTIRETLMVKPDITLEEFIETLQVRWLSQIESSYDREISVVVKEYKSLVHKLITTAISK